MSLKGLKKKKLVFITFQKMVKGGMYIKKEDSFRAVLGRSSSWGSKMNFTYSTPKVI